MPNLEEELRNAINNYKHDDEELESAYLTSFMVTCEWVGPDGERYFSTIGSENLTSWMRMGYAMETVSQGIANDVAARLFDTANEDDE